MFFSSSYEPVSTLISTSVQDLVIIFAPESLSRAAAVAALQAVQKSPSLSPKRKRNLAKRFKLGHILWLGVQAKDAQESPTFFLLMR